MQTNCPGMICFIYICNRSQLILFYLNDGQKYNVGSLQSVLPRLPMSLAYLTKIASKKNCFMLQNTKNEWDFLWAIERKTFMPSSFTPSF